MATIGNLVVKVAASLGSLQSDLARGGALVRSFGGEVKSLNAPLAQATGLMKGFGAVSIAAGASAAIASLAHAFRQVGEELDATIDSAYRLGLTTQELRRLQYMAAVAGVEFSTLERAIKAMVVRTSEAAAGSEKAQKVFKEMGMAVPGKGTYEELHELADALDGVTDAGDRARLGVELFGSKGLSMLNLLEGGSRNMKAMAEEFDRTGVVTEEMARRVDEFGQDLDAAKLKVKNFFAVVYADASIAAGALTKLGREWGLVEAGIKAVKSQTGLWLAMPLIERLNAMRRETEAAKTATELLKEQAEALAEEQKKLADAYDKTKKSMENYFKTQESQLRILRGTSTPLMEGFLENRRIQLDALLAQVPKAGPEQRIEILKEYFDVLKKTSEEFKRLQKDFQEAETNQRQAREKGEFLQGMLGFREGLKNELAFGGLTQRMRELTALRMDLLKFQWSPDDRAALESRLDQIEADAKHLDALDEEKKRRGEIAREIEETARRWKDLSDEVATPEEKYLQQMAELRKWLGMGLSPAWADRFAENYARQMLGSFGDRGGAALAPALESGSAESISARNRALYGGGDAAREQRELVRQQVALLREANFQRKILVEKAQAPRPLARIAP